MRTHRPRFEFGLCLLLIATLLAGCGASGTPTTPPTAAASAAVAATPAPSPATTKVPPTATSVPPSPTPATPTVGGTVVIRVSRDPDTLDAQKTAESGEGWIGGFYGSTLIARDLTAASKYVPYLAEKWSVSADALTWEFTLAKGIRFHDGTPCTAADYVYTLQRAKDPETKSPALSKILRSVSSIEVVDDLTFRISLAQPFVTLLDNLTLSWFQPLPKAGVESAGDQFGRAPIGVGPFKFKEWKTGEKVVLERNPDFAWGPSFAHKGPAYIQTLEFRIIPEPATAVAGLEARELDVSSILVKDIARIESTGAYRLLNIPTQGLAPMVDMNVSKPPFDDVRVRQAFNLAVDRAALVKVAALGRAVVQYGPLTSTVFGYWPGVEEIGYGFDLPRAKALMQEAGYAAGADGILTKNGEPLKLTLLASSGNAEYPKCADLLQQQWKALGVDIRISLSEGGTVWATAIAGDYDLTVMDWVYADATLLYASYSSKMIGALNLSQVNDPDLDAILEALVVSSTSEQFMEIAAQAQKYVVEKALIVPLYTGGSFVGVSNRVMDPTIWWNGQYHLFDAWVPAR